MPLLIRENDASWRWFLSNSRDAFGQRLEMCIASDKHASIIRQPSESMMKYLILRVMRQINMCILYLMVLHNSTACLHQRICIRVEISIDELPCPHALVLLTIKHTGYEKYCSDYYTRKNLLLTYQFQMDPLPDESTWNTPTHVLEEGFTFARECGMLNISQKMLEICKRINTPPPHNAFAYWKELICKRLCAISIRPDASSDDGFAYWKKVIWKTKQEFRAKYSFPKTLLADNKVDDDTNPKFVMEFIDAVVGNLNVLVKINDPFSLLFVPGPKEQIEQVLKELKLLRFFVCFVSNKCIEPQYQHTTFYINIFANA
ncbi:hypothetical protein H5410_047904 [Solanum commersonii]|uniref:Late blight resistance protein R1A-like N-terminal domain-containing protein n=1 Tax=Solanum commersonii TaxID=4109 RepID=A0A9J5XK27_SOLCO|nr:hypothetical protein H5410_047904 [Solanum commersonii]